MWNVVSIQLDSNGAGNGNIFSAKAQILGRLVVPVQAGINSGVTKLVMSDLFPSNVVPSPILTLTTITTPYNAIPQRLPVDNVNVAGASLAYQLVGSLNISITNGAANQLVTLAVLLTDD